MKVITKYKSEKYKVGMIYPTYTGEVEILGRAATKDIRYIVKFLNTNTVLRTTSSNILSGTIKDIYFPIIEGVGYIGKSVPNSKVKRRVYTLWSNMLRRCYGETYDKYGNKRRTYANVIVDTRWFDFSNFFNDIKYLKGYGEWLNNTNYQLDKDKNAINSDKIYSINTCEFISKEDNIKLGHETQKVKAEEVWLVNSLGKLYFVRDYRKFSLENNLKAYSVLKLIRRDQNVLEGWRLAGGTKVYYFNIKDEVHKYTDLSILAKQYNTMTSIFWKLIRKEREIYKDVKFLYSRTIKTNELY